MMCCCGHTDRYHVRFARREPCVVGDCPCEDFDFGGGPTRTVTPHADTFVPPCPTDANTRELKSIEALKRLTIARELAEKSILTSASVSSDTPTWPKLSPVNDTCLTCPPGGNCGECLYPACPNKGKAP